VSIPTVIITGASSGIGEATALAFAKQGAQVVLAARQVEKLMQVKEACLKAGAKACEIVGCDVSKEEDCKRLIETTIHQFSRIDVLINNAGISMRALFDECELDVIKRLMDTNFWGTVYCTKYALPQLLQHKGSVVTVSSVAGLVGLPARTGYSASKFALEGFMQSLRIENLKKGLHVGMIYPGYTASNIRNTALNSSGNTQQESPLDESKLMTPEEVAEAIVRMVKSRQRNKILTGIGHLSRWINILMPSRSDRMVYNFVAKEKDSPFK
jgi:short-subunit dehydrogenase